MIKNKYFHLFLVFLISIGQISAIPVIAVEENKSGAGPTIITDWENIDIEDFKDDSDVSPDYYPEDHDRWGGVGGPSSNTGVDNNQPSTGKPLDEIEIKRTYKLENNVCYETVTNTTNGKTTKKESKVEIAYCVDNGASFDGKPNNVGQIDLNSLDFVPTKPGQGANIQYTDEEQQELLEQTSDFEVVKDDKGKFLYLLHKPSGEKFKSGDKITIDGYTIGTVSDDGQIDTSTNTNTKGFYSSLVQNDLNGIGENTHSLYLTTDKTKENPELIDLKINVNADGTISQENFELALTKTVEEVNGQILHDKDRTVYFIDGVLILSLLNNQETISVNEFPNLFEKVKTLIVVKPKNL